jgi:hypothetical protein
MTLAQYQEIYDRLIKIFQERPRDDWKKLIVLSKQWPQHSKGVFDRCGAAPRALHRVAAIAHCFTAIKNAAQHVACHRLLYGTHHYQACAPPGTAPRRCCLPQSPAATSTPSTSTACDHPINAPLPCTLPQDPGAGRPGV